MKKITIFKICAISALAFFIGLVAVLASVNPQDILSKGYTYSSNSYTLSNSNSDNYQLELDSKSLAFRVKEKVSGKIVMESGNILPDSENYDNGLNKTWEQFAQSAVTVYYTNEKVYTPLTGFESVEIEVEEISKGFQARINIDDIQLRFTLKIELIGDCVEVSIPFSSINEKRPDRNPLLEIVVYPFINTTKGVQEGAQDSYIFVPDGSGAIIDTTKKSSAKNIYSSRVYGDDYGIVGNAGIKVSGSHRPAKTQLYPVFGMVSNGSGFMGDIVAGDEYASILAYASGIVTDYNFVYSKFTYREKYYQPIDNAGTTVSANQKDINKTDIKVRYSFLTGNDATYSGMANKYREKLEESKVLKNAVKNAVPVKADFLMADSYESTFGRTVVPVTGAAFALEALNNLKSGGIKALSSGIVGYSSGGKTGAAPNHSKIGGKTGSSEDYKKLFGYTGGSVYPVTNYTLVDNEISSYSKRDLVLSLGKEFIEFPDYEGTYNYFDAMQTLNPSASKKYLSKDLEEFKGKYGINGIQIKGLNILLSSFNDEKYIRSDSKKAVVEMINGIDVNLSAENVPSYLWNKVKEFTASPLSGSSYIIALESVPFLQMVTGKYIDHFSPYVNLDYNSEADIVKMVDYNVNLSYILTELNSFELVMTPSSRVFSSEFSLWGDRIKETYSRVEPVMSKVRGAACVKREKLAEGVFKNTYENGVEILVNYTNSDYSLNGNTVKALNFALGGNNG